MARYDASLTQQSSAPAISRRAYNALTYGLVTVSFIILWGTYQFANGGGLDGIIRANPLVVLIGSLVATIGGVVLMSVGKSKQSVPLALAGYVIFSLTFGITMALALQHYSIGTITYAFGITACVSGIFLIAGVMFPQFFARIGGVLFVGLIGVCLAEFIAVFFFHASQTIFDYIVIVLFCGFLGYDSYIMSSDEPTVPNAIFHASNIYIDILNILIRVLDIMDRD